MRIVFLGAGERALICLRRLMRDRFNIVGFVGIEYTGFQEEIELICTCSSIPYTVGSNYCQWVKEKNPDVIVMSWNKIVGKKLLSIPTECTMNLHGGPVPKYRGSSVINWQIINGETVGGCSILRVDEGIDTGNVLSSKAFDIDPDDNAQTVTEKTLRIFPDMLVDVLGQSFVGKEQSPRKAIYWHHRKLDDSKIQWKEMSDVQVHNLVRGTMSPYKSFCFCHRNDVHIVEISESKLMDEEYKGIPGRVVCKHNDGMIVICNNRGLWVKADMKLARGDALS